MLSPDEQGHSPPESGPMHLQKVDRLRYCVTSWGLLTTTGRVSYRTKGTGATLASTLH